jgi:Na+-driven multidrug efflux pump
LIGSSSLFYISKENIPSKFFAGVAIGAGWQSLVAFINIGCYYFIGIPLGALFGFKLNLDAMVSKNRKEETS